MVLSQLLKTKEHVVIVGHSRLLPSIKAKWSGEKDQTIKLIYRNSSFGNATRKVEVVKEAIWRRQLIWV